MNRVSLPLLIALAFTFGCDAIKKEEDGLTDSRDGKKYKTVKIGEQTWMAENLNYAAEGSVCYDNKPENCAKYGRLYTWDNAMKACPSGWHLPTNTEWDKLLHFVDGTNGTESPYKSPTAGKFLKAKSGWKDYEDYEGNPVGNGTDAFGFAALPGGFYGYDNIEGDTEFKDLGSFGAWWSADEIDGTDAATGQSMNYYEFAVFQSHTIYDCEECPGYSYGHPKYFLSSVRCIKD